MLLIWLGSNIQEIVTVEKIIKKKIQVNDYEFQDNTTYILVSENKINQHN